MKLTFKNGAKEFVADCVAEEVAELTKHLPALLVASGFHDAPPLVTWLNPNPSVEPNPWFPRMGPGSWQVGPGDVFIGGQALNPKIDWTNIVQDGRYTNVVKSAFAKKDICGCGESCPD